MTQPTGTTQPTTTRPTLRRGDRGAAVSDLQRLLQQAGYNPGVIDGAFGTGTESALRFFQSDRGLTSDGVAGARTWAALEGAGSPSTPSNGSSTQPAPAGGSQPSPSSQPSGTTTRPTLRRGSRGADVADLQRRLTSAGYNAGTADGIFGAGTETAVRSFQRDNGLPVDGVVGPRTWQALLGGETTRSNGPPGAPMLETSRNEAPRPDTGDLAAALASGVADAASSEGLRVVSLASANESGSGAAAVRVEAVNRQQEGPAPRPASLRESLRQLMQKWEAFGAGDGAQVRRRASVLVVGPGTRVSNNDLQMMRRLGFLGDLYVVSGDAAILRYLAQRLHMTHGVHFRLAPTPEEVAKVAREALAEASGGQGLVLDTETVELEAGRVRTNARFAISRADRRFQLVIEAANHPVDVSVTRPGGGAERLESPATRDALRLFTRRDGATVLESASAEYNWAGEWLVSVSSSLPAPAIHAQVWSSLQIDVAVGKGPTAESSREDGRPTVIVSGAEGVTVSSVRVKDVGTAAAIGGESTRDESAFVTPSRLDRIAEASSATGASTETARIELRAETLQAKAPESLPGEGPDVVDLAVTVSGADAEGYRFRRELRSNVVRLQSRSSWRRQRRRLRAPSFFPAVVEQVSYAADREVSGLTLSRDTGSVYVRVTEPGLRKLLTRLKLPRANLHFEVHGDQLVSLIHIVARDAVESPRCNASAAVYP